MILSEVNVRIHQTGDATVFSRGTGLEWGGQFFSSPPTGILSDTAEKLRFSALRPRSCKLTLEDTSICDIFVQEVSLTQQYISSPPLLKVVFNVEHWFHVGPSIAQAFQA